MPGLVTAVFRVASMRLRKHDIQLRGGSLRISCSDLECTKWSEESTANADLHKPHNILLLRFVQLQPDHRRHIFGSDCHVGHTM
jgi:hypothetical protein